MCFDAICLFFAVKSIAFFNRDFGFFCKYWLIWGPMGVAQSSPAPTPLGAQTADTLQSHVLPV